MLDNFDGLLDAIRKNFAELFRIERRVTVGDIYCPSCGGERRVELHKVVAPRVRDTPPDKDKIVPSLFLMVCVQCDHLWTAVFHRGPDGSELALFTSAPGGLATPNTPESVAYYLDQAARAQSVGANSAAVAMFRAALDHILFEQGYTSGMLGSRIEKLEKDMAEGTAPSWTESVDADLLRFLKDLGNASIHTNDGTVRDQDAFDRSLLTKVSEAFQFLLEVVYEAPRRKASLLEALRAKVASLGEEPQTPEG